VEKYRKEIITAIGLLVLAVALHLLHYAIFHDMHHLLLYGLGDLAFLPIEVLIVTFIFHRVLEWHNKKVIASKINMIIGSFFSEMGMGLPRMFISMDKNQEKIKNKLHVSNQWKEKNFTKEERFFSGCKPEIQAAASGLKDLRELLLTKRSFLAELMQSPVLIEHKSFTNLLLAVFHLTEELHYRKDLGKSPKSALEHLGGNIERAYRRILAEWLGCLYGLKVSYPYLFSLALRLNPLVGKIDVLVR